MPNWCSNQIFIGGSVENMKPIIENLTNMGNDDLVMNVLIPNKDNISQSDFYGTKWDFAKREIYDSIDDSLFEGSDSLLINISTAWSPPIPFCKKLSEQYGVNVSIEYSEPGNDFAGKCEFKNGEEIVNKEWTYYIGMYHLDQECFENDIINLVEQGESLDDILQSIDTEDEDIIEFVTEIYNENKEDE